jgi:hypothetical protein
VGEAAGFDAHCLKPADLEEIIHFVQGSATSVPL